MSTRASPRLKAKMAAQEAEESKSQDAPPTSGGLPPLLIFVIVQTLCHGVAHSLAYAVSSSEASYQTLRTLLLMSFGIQFLVFIHAGGLFGNERTEKFYDLTGAITYLSVLFSSIHAHGGWSSMSARQKILSACVTVWCVRLGSFLFSRIQREGSDSRFTVIKKNNFRFLTAWTLQGLWVFITAMPVFVLNTIPADTTPLGNLDYTGISLWIIGFVFEVTADMQKTAFREISANKGKFITSGVWSLSRHPNYFGEITLWVGVFLSALNGLIVHGNDLLPSLLAHSKSSQLYCLIFSPVFVYLLLNFVSGVNLLEASSDAKWGSKKDYRDYKTKTPVLFPKLF